MSTRSADFALDAPRAYLHSPAVARNRDPILVVLRRHLPANARVLEVASGTGEHAAWFAAALPGVRWQPSDPDSEMRRSIAAQTADTDTVLPPIHLDAAHLPWPTLDADAVVCINLCHIAPWPATTGLVAGAASLLGPGGILYIYGPFTRKGGHTAPSNAAFDRYLRTMDETWGVRDLDEIAELARHQGLELEEIIEMPSNNLSAVFMKP